MHFFSSGEEPEPPRFEEPLVSITIKEGDEAKFECRISGNPKPEVNWFRDNVMLNKTDVSEIGHDKTDKYWVTMKETVVGDSGTFTCLAENIAGRTISGAELIVQTGM